MISEASTDLLKKIASKVDVEPDEVETAYPCTTLQAALLAANLQDSGSYVSTFVFDISASSFHPQDVKQACEILYDRTPILRTRFFQSKGSFLQVVTATRLEWSEYKSLEEFLELDHERQINLGGALVDFVWIKNDANEVSMVWSVHHALYDEWSFSLLLADLSQLLTNPEEFKPRPHFSRFVKAVSLIDHQASKQFWRQWLQGIENAKPLNFDGDLFETSRQVEHSSSIAIAQERYQASTIAIASWSIFLAKMSKSNTVCFGNIVNGRAINVPAIVDICGPTMTTVPYVVEIPWGRSVTEFLDELQSARNDMLPYEQEGLSEYRQASGSGRFETLLSIRTSQGTLSSQDLELQPGTTKGRQVRHPCCLYLDVVLEGSECTVKASFDERFVDGGSITAALDVLSTLMRDLSMVPASKVTELANFTTPSGLMINSNGHTSKQSSEGDPELTIDLDILDRVQKIAQQISPGNGQVSVGPETSLRELGLDSLGTVMLARQLGETFSIDLPFKQVTGLRKTISDVSTSIQRTLQGDNQSSIARLDLLRLAEDHVKAFKLQHTTPAPSSDLDFVLLTGASGYVGIEILRQLLASCNSRIALLVRCESPETGLQRIHHNARIAKWNEAEVDMLAKRTEIWPADLQSPQLGLDSEHLERLKTIRRIVHNGARVDFSMDYHDLTATNVDATAFLLSEHLKSVAHPSFVYVTGGRGSPVEAEGSLAQIAAKLASAGGYAQSKFVGEVLLYRAYDLCHEAGREASMSIVHPGAVIGSQLTGVANIDDYVWRYVAASIQMRAYVPAVPTKREWINLMSVDRVASEVVSAASRPIGSEEVCRVSMRSGLSVARLWEIVVETLGSSHVLEPVSEWEWSRRLEVSINEEGSSHPLYSLSHLLQQGSLKGIGGPGLKSEQMPKKEDLMATEKAIRSNLRFLEKVGFFSRDTRDNYADQVFGRSKR